MHGQYFSWSGPFDGGHEEEKDTIEQDLSQSEVLEIDGDLFYEAEEDMIESDEEQDDNEEGIAIAAALDALTAGENSNIPIPEEMELGNDDNNDDAAPAVMLEETPLPRMFIPGKIVHIYTHRGAYKATEVPRKFRELRHISLAGNINIDICFGDNFMTPSGSTKGLAAGDVSMARASSSDHGKNNPEVMRDERLRTAISSDDSDAAG